MKHFIEKHPQAFFTLFGAVFGLLFGVLIVRNLPVGQVGGAFEGYAWLWGLAVGSYVGFQLGRRNWRR